MVTLGNMTEEFKLKCLAEYLLKEMREGKKTRQYIEAKYTENRKKSEAFREKLKAELNRQRKETFRA